MEVELDVEMATSFSARESHSAGGTFIILSG